MGKRIRHLEFYGYPDQNVFTSLGNVDLSEINETNREQDAEISGLTKDKADLSLVLELSGKVDTFIEEQDSFNRSVVDAFSGATSRIAALENRDEEITNKINELADEVNEDRALIGEFGETISALTEDFDAHIDEFNEFKEEVNCNFSSMTEALDGKLGKDEAEEIYAKKSEVYSREEADETFLKEHQDISHLATKEELAELQEQVDSIDTESFAKKEDLDALSGDYVTYKEQVNGAIADINDNVSEIADSVEEAFDAIDSLDNSINELGGALNSLSGAVNELSASATSLSTRIDGIEEELDGYVTRDEFTAYAIEQDEVNREIKLTKADKTELEAVSGAVDGLYDRIEQEKAERISGDSALDSKIDGIVDEISGIVESALTIYETVSTLDAKIDEETENRKAADKALIGTSGDTFDDDTIWGAKKYAMNQRGIAVAESKEYTDNAFDGIETLVTNELDSVRTELSGKASKSYVDETISERDEQIRSDLNAKIDAEIDRAKSSENNLQYQINELYDRSWSGDTKEIYKRINVITTYSGDTPEEYVNTGNGVLDVLHREFHQFVDESGIQVNPTVVKTNEYESAFGTYNISNTGVDPSEQTIFSVGIGTSDSERKNAVEVRKNGDLYLWVEGEFMKVNDLLAMLAHETY